MTLCLTPPVSDQWLRPAEYWLSLHAATAKLDPLCGVISIAALAHNAFDLLWRAGGTSIRIVSRSTRCPPPGSP